MSESTKNVSDALVDEAYEAAGGHAEAAPLTWAMMKTALETVAPKIREQKVPDNAKALEYLERMRRFIDNCPDDYTKDNLRLLYSDVHGELAP